MVYEIIGGTGLSIIYGIQGMIKLAIRFQKEIGILSDVQLQEMWKKHYLAIASDRLGKELECEIKQHEDKRNFIVRT